VVNLSQEQHCNNQVKNQLRIRIDGTGFFVFSEECTWGLTMRLILSLLPSYAWMSAFILTNCTLLSTLLKGLESGVARSAIYCSVLIRLTGYVNLSYSLIKGSFELGASGKKVCYACAKAQNAKKGQPERITKGGAETHRFL
jgi:hypothetical protein